MTNSQESEMNSMHSAYEVGHQVFIKSEFIESDTSPASQLVESDDDDSFFREENGPNSQATKSSSSPIDLPTPTKPDTNKEHDYPDAPVVTVLKIKSEPSESPEPEIFPDRQDEINYSGEDIRPPLTYFSPPVTNTECSSAVSTIVKTETIDEESNVEDPLRIDFGMSHDRTFQSSEFSHDLKSEDREHQPERIIENPSHYSKVSSTDCGSNDGDQANSEASRPSEMPTRADQVNSYVESISEECTSPPQSGKKPFSCSYCAAAFAHRSEFTIHVRKHTGEKPFSCPECSASFSRKSTLNRHTLLHTGEKPYRCSNCSASFAQKVALLGHMRTHTGEKPFSCPDCSATFTLKTTLTRHLLLHTGEKPFSCSHCPASFTQKHHLTVHMQMHGGEKPFSCSLCSASFWHKSDCTRHMQKHTGERPFSCSHCPLTFLLSSDLARHMRKHTGEKPFKCCDCSASFALKSTLLRHVALHAREKPFSCSHCSASFGHKNHLNTHVNQVHTPKKPLSSSDGSV
ncbi:unnamed protein product [Bemisia tabaci]|uniref:C2H2-type domain-containing protein n=1 Tax=Bemisia tabaci TaxID=7038 RepID=A0A9P0CGH7_BEMTA|nr:unnamed protein product [Bemisia tabaci]